MQTYTVRTPEGSWEAPASLRIHEWVHILLRQKDIDALLQWSQLLAAGETLPERRGLLPTMLPVAGFPVFWEGRPGRRPNTCSVVYFKTAAGTTVSEYRP